MKRRAAGKNPVKVSIAKREKPLDITGNGAWNLIAMKAYELYEERGRVDGHALEDWLKAEAIVNGQNE